jgi:hypothetical protein
MLRGMTETPDKSPSEPPERPDRPEGDDSADLERDTIVLPSHVAGSGTLDRLVETARNYALAAASENTLKAYAKDWAHFARWCRMRGADPLPASPQLIGLYIADLVAPGGKAPALSVGSIERRLSGLAGAMRSAASSWTARTATLLPCWPASAASTPGLRSRRRRSCPKTCATCWPPCPTICAVCATGPSC